MTEEGPRLEEIYSNGNFSLAGLRKYRDVKSGWQDRFRINGHTLLTLAMWSNNYLAVSELLRGGANPYLLNNNTVNWVNFDQIITGLNVFCYFNKKSDTDIIDKFQLDPNSEILVTRDEDGKPVDWLYPLHLFLVSEKYDIALALLSKMKNGLPETAPGKGFLSYVDPRSDRAWPVIKKLCEMGCRDSVSRHGDTLLSIACTEDTPACIRVVDYLCLSPHRQNYKEGEGADMNLSRFNRDGRFSVIENVIARDKYVHLYPLRQISKSRLLFDKDPGELSPSFLDAVWMCDYDRVGGGPGVQLDPEQEQDHSDGVDEEEKQEEEDPDKNILKDIRKACSIAFELENPLMLQILIRRFSRGKTGLSMIERLFPGKKMLSMTQFALASTRVAFSDWFFSLEVCDFSLVSIETTISHLNRYMEYSVFEKMLAKSAEYMRSSRENLALRPCSAQDVKALIRYDRFDLIFLLNKYRKITRLVLHETDVRPEYLVCSNEKGTEISIDQDPADEESKYQDAPKITEERMDKALKASELFFQQAGEIDWFQITFGWNAQKRNRVRPFLPSDTKNAFLPPPVMELVAHFILMQTKYPKE